MHGMPQAPPGRPSLARLVLGSIRLVAGTILLGVAAVFLIIVVPLVLTERRFAADGQTADATVLSKNLRPATADRGTVYEVTYHLTTPESAPMQQTEPVSVATWEAVEEGGRVRVQYLPGDVESVRLERRRDTLALTLGLTAGSGLAIAGAWLCAGGARRVRQKLRLYSHGLRADATVTDIRESSVTVNKRRWYVVAFTYIDQMGREHRATSDPMPWEEAAVWRPGQTASIRYDLDQPERCVWVGQRG